MATVLSFALNGTRIKQESHVVMTIQEGDESRFLQSRYMWK